MAAHGYAHLQNPETRVETEFELFDAQEKIELLTSKTVYE